MASVFDVAKYLIRLSEPDTERSMTHLKLQKLVYYSHAWHLAMGHGPLVEDDRIEAWIHGPVFPRLYNYYREYGYREIIYADELLGEPNELSLRNSNVIDVVWDIYGSYSGKYLENLTHTEDPWLDARRGQNYFDHGNNIIDDNIITNYFGERLVRN